MRGLNISGRLLLMGGVSVGTLGLSVAGLTWTSYEAVVQQRQQELQSIVDLSDSLIAGASDPAEATAALSELRYRGSEYVFVLDKDLNMVMHPIKPQMNNTSVANVKDPTGKFLFREMVTAAKNPDGGVVHYQWPKPGSENPVPKMSFVQTARNSDWIIATGVYMDDVMALLDAAYSARNGRAPGGRFSDVLDQPQSVGNNHRPPRAAAQHDGDPVGRKDRYSHRWH